MVVLEMIIALFLGILTGIITGITPGIHVNLVSVIVLSLSPLLLSFTTPVVLGVYIISLAITHTFLDTLPSIYLGAPDEGKALTVLPGHRLLLQGEGHNAVLYTILGSLGSLLLGTLFFPLFILGMAFLFPITQNIVGYLLIAAVVFLIAREKNKLKCLVVFLLAGCLGLLVFKLTSLHQPLFPLLSGLFGVSLMIVSLKENPVIPEQKLHTPLNISSKNSLQSISLATGLGFIAAFLPGFGSSQAAVIGTTMSKNLGDEGFLSLVGGINTANMLISIATAYALDKARNGAIVVINDLMGSITFSQMLLFLGIALIAGGIATILTIHFSKLFARMIVKIDYALLVWCILAFIVLLTYYFDSFLGLVILFTAASIGLLGSSWCIAKSHLMGCLLVPVILYFIL